MTRARLAVACLALLAAPGAWPTPAAGQPAQGQPAKPDKIYVHSLTFKGVRQVDPSQLKAALATRTSSRLPWGKKALFDRAKFETDLERIRAFYVDHGFPDARVTSFDLHLNKQDTRLDIAITVSEGEPIRVTAIDFTGTGDVPPAHLQAVKRQAPLKVGQPLDRPALATTREMVANELRDHGFPYATVTVDHHPGPTSHTAVVVFNAKTGPKSYFGRTEITGTREIGDDVIRRELVYKEGGLFRRSEVQESQRRLYDLELFQFVSVRRDRGENVTPPGAPSAPEGGGAPPPTSPDEPDARPLPIPKAPTDTLPRLDQPLQPTRIPMRVTVTESKHRHVQASAGYGTEEKARVEGEFRQLNFFGGARSAAIHGKWSSLDRGARVEFNNPYFFAPRWSLQLSGERWYDNEPAFTSVASGGHATLAFRPNALNSYSVTLTDEYQSSQISNAALSDLSVRGDLIALGLDPTTGSQAGTLNALSFDMRRNTSGNLLNPTRGYSVAVHLEQAGRWVRGTFAYSNASIDGRYYLPVTRKLVFATRAQLGSLRPASGLVANVPFSKRYFLGGATSLRGWGRYELSPLSGSGLPIGGFSMFQGSLEGRLSLTRSIGAVAFVDFGNVYTQAWKVSLNDLRYDVGPGFRYQTPVGPLRVDLGYQLNPVPGLLVNGQPQTRRWRIHFSIGQAF